jgi:hypothetical protein
MPHIMRGGELLLPDGGCLEKGELREAFWQSWFSWDNFEVPIECHSGASGKTRAVMSV